MINKIIGIVLIIATFTGLVLTFSIIQKQNISVARALSTDGYPSAIESNPCPWYVQPSSTYDMTNPSGVKSGQTWLGNNFCGSDTKKDPENRLWNAAPSGISDIFAQPDGTVLTTATFDEAAKGLGAWKDGQIAYPGVFNETVNRAGRTITGDGTGNISFYPQVERRVGNQIIVGDGDHRPRSEYQLASSEETFAITGMAAQNGKLYTTSSITNKIKVWNYTVPTAGLTDANQNWNIPARPGKLVFDKNNTLWLLNDPEGASPTLTQYSTAGVQLKQFSFPSGYIPSSIVFGDNNQAYIGDSGIDQQIKINDVSGSNLVQTETFGVQFGSSAGPTKGLTGPLRFRGTFNGLGLDASGNIYMTTGYGNDTTLSAYKLSDGTRNWMIENNQFQKIVAADPGSDNGDSLNFYSANLRTNFDFSKPKGKQFAVAAQVEDFDQGLNKASISVLNRFSFLTRVNGQLLTYGIDTKDNEGPVVGEQLIIRKNTPGNGELQSDSGAIICNGVQSNKTLKIWRDINNNGIKDASEISESTNLPALTRKCEDNFGYHVDENSGIWKFWPGIALIYLPLQGMDNNNNPIYSWETARVWNDGSLPVGLNSTDPIAYGYYTFNYDSKRDIATFLANTNEATGKYKITVVDNLLKGNLTPKWSTMVPINGCGCFFRTHISVAGDLVMLNQNLDADPASPTLLEDMDNNAGRTHMWNINNGDYLGISQNDRSLFKYQSGTIDAQYQTYGYQRNNGEILNIVEDVYETKTRITQIQSPITAITSVGTNVIPSRDNMGNRVLSPETRFNIPKGITLITASANVKEGSISKVEFFIKDVTDSNNQNPLETKIGEDINGSNVWSFNWDTSNLLIGNKYQIFSRASIIGSPVPNTSQHFNYIITNEESQSESSSSSLPSLNSSLSSNSSSSSKQSSTSQSLSSSQITQASSSLSSTFFSTSSSSNSTISLNSISNPNSSVSLSSSSIFSESTNSQSPYSSSSLSSSQTSIDSCAFTIPYRNPCPAESFSSSSSSENSNSNISSSQKSLSTSSNSSSDLSKSSSSQSSSASTYSSESPEINPEINAQILNKNVCDRFETLDYINVSGQKKNSFIQFKAKCPGILIKTYWPSLDRGKNYQFVKYNPENGARNTNFPSTVGVELLNDKQTIFTIHNVTDNETGDFNSEAGIIFDPFGLVEIEANTGNTSNIPNDKPISNSPNAAKNVIAQKDNIENNEIKRQLIRTGQDSFAVVCLTLISISVIVGIYIKSNFKKNKNKIR